MTTTILGRALSDLTEHERCAVGELIGLSEFCRTARDRDFRSMHLICAERAVSILRGDIAPHVASDEDIETFWVFWHPAGKRRL